MKKISIIFAVLAVFMLLASCSNAAGEVDLAGNPVELTGTWEGTLAYKGATQKDLPMSCVEDDSTNGYTDYAGTYVIESSFTAPSDYTEMKVDGTNTIAYKHLFNMGSTTEKITYVVNSDGSISATYVETYTQAARAEQTAAANTVYRVYSDPSDLSDFDDVTTVPEFIAYAYTVTTTSSSTAPVIRADLDYDITTTQKTVTVSTIGGVTSSVTQEEPTTYQILTDTEFETLLKSLPLDKRTVTPTLKPVEWQNDITETITFTVTNDGLYTLTSVVEVTQAEAAAAEATATNYAAAERKLSTKTTTRTTTGTVVAWGTPATDTTPATSTMALSSGVETYSVTATEDFLDENLNTPTVGKFAGAREYEIRFFEGKAGRKETAKTRMYVDISTAYDLDPYIAIFDKQTDAPEEE